MRSTSAIATFAALVALAGCGFDESMFWQTTKPEAEASMPAAPVAAAAEPSAPREAPARPLLPAPPAETRKPFVVIRFEGREPDFARPLYTALEGALARKPDVDFDLVAVTRDADAAQRNLARVYRAITAMGMPAERLSLAAAAAEDDATDEVWIYLR
jgi:hypothetical protein